jgi:hypothetical protein
MGAALNTRTNVVSDVSATFCLIALTNSGDSFFFRFGERLAEK